MKLFIKSGSRELVIENILIGENPVVGEAYIKLVGKSKVKTTATLDPEKMTSHREFVEKTLTENRMNQFVEKMRELGHPMNITSTGLYIKAISADIFREEADTMVASLIEPKDVMGIIATTAKKFWFEALNKEAGL